ncbi:spectrin beta chain, non-erythrocytic 4-like, partial [Empidonax traillii]|uniref:spectrin beta chain, non-erythrocytic 4-like n=1 Tax=Empidonax traillii TaxID=164674 RepID=UPI000FFDB656
ERDAVQKKTFTKWVNAHLARAACRVGDLYVDLRDGFVLTRLLEVLSGESLPGEGTFSFISFIVIFIIFIFIIIFIIVIIVIIFIIVIIINVIFTHLLEVLSGESLGHHLGTFIFIVIFMIIFIVIIIIIIIKSTSSSSSQHHHRQINIIIVKSTSSSYPEVNIQNFTTSWRDGLAFNALIHRHRPDLVDFAKLTKSNATHNLQVAFNTAEQHLGLSKLLDPEDVNMEDPDEKSIITYVVSFYHYFSKMKALAVEGKRIGKDNFGYDLPAVEAAMKKHEAIEADISSYQERIQVVVELALEMEAEGYYDTKRISAQKDNILRQWGLLTQLVAARRARLEQNLALQKIFQEMVYMIDWMEEMQVLLVSKDLGKHLLEVEDLLQKQGLLEADIAAQTERVQALNAAALTFSELEGYQPCDPQIICNRVHHVRSCLEELAQLAAKRRKELEDSRQLWTFFQEMEEAEAWMGDKEKILAHKTCGRDLSSVTALAAEHRAMLGELGKRRALLHQSLKKGEKLLARRPPGGGGGGGGSGGVRERLRSVCLRWKKLEELTGLHQRRLEEASAFFQFLAETDELAAWLRSAFRVAASDDFGHDEHSSRALLRQHRALVEELEKQREAVLALRGQLALLAPDHRQGVEAQIRVVEAEQLFGEVAEVAVLRTQWLQDALAVYGLLGEVDACEAWLDEKEQWLGGMEVPEELDEVEVVQH